MSKYNADKGLNTFTKILTVILAVLLVIGLCGGLVYLLKRPQGIYIVYDGVQYGNSVVGSSSAGISVERADSVEFRIGNSQDWGAYSADDCIVKIVPNVDETHDFEFTVSGEDKPYLYSAIEDLSAAFCKGYDGNGIPVSSDGVFTISADYIYLKDMLSAVYGDEITPDDELAFADYPYIAISVTPPDGSEPLVFPLLLVGEIEVEGIHFDKDGVVL